MELKIKRWDSHRINYIYYGYNDFYDFDNFTLKMLENLKSGYQYSLLLKVRFNEDRYSMVGRQIGFNYEDSNDIERFENLHESYMDMLENFYDDYDVEEVHSFQLLYVLINEIPELKQKNVNRIMFNKEFAKIKESKEKFNLLPLTTKVSYFGKLILDDKLTYLDRINSQRSILNQDRLSIDSIGSIYLYKDKYIILNIEKGNVIDRSIYNSKSGILIGEVKDELIGENLFIRKIGNASLTISEDKFIKIEFEKKLSSIKYKTKTLKDEPNPFIGSWDIEAFEENGYAKVYALGFVILGKEPNTYYLDSNSTSEDLVLKCLDDMLVNQYNGYTFYTHNFGRYDSTFLIKILMDENIKRGVEHYKLNILARDNKVLKLVIKVKKSLGDKKQSTIGVRKDPGYNTITIVDSLNLLNQSLDKLCHSFNVEVTKGKFPHSFVKRDTLYYVGNTPHYKYWNGIDVLDYNNMVKSDWNLKEECLLYLEKDLISLTLIMNKFGEYINRKYHLQITDSLTISRLALNIFLKEYLKDSKLPIVGRNMFSDIKEGYYGGVTEVYIPYGKDLLYYDVNSLYPFAALNSMPGINCIFIENISNSLSVKDIFGFFYCEIQTTDDYLGLLPHHSKNGLIMPNGSWKGWYFSEELKFASEQGYIINVIKGYKFNKVENVFTNYVNDFYKVKSTTTDKVEKDINKRLLNHLLGRFGMNIYKPSTEVVNGDELSMILSTRKVKGDPKRITEDNYWLTFDSDIDKQLCDEHNLDYFKVCNLTSKKDIEKLNEFNDVSITTAAAVTAYARIYMSKVKLDIINKGGKVYYTDTDSIVTDISLDENLVGNQLGQFKLEYNIDEGYFISNKTYCLVLSNQEVNKKDIVIKSKTVKSSSLTLNSFKELYLGKNVEAIKTSAITDYNKGSVLICENKVNLKHDSYIKRIKLYKGDKWVNTKPLVLDGNNIDNKSSKVEKKKYNTYIKVNKSTISYLLNVFIDFSFTVLLTAISVILFMCVNEEVYHNLEIYLDDNDTHKVCELRYLDDYMEEPVEVETLNNESYITTCKDLFIDITKIDRFVNLFTDKNYKLYSLNKDYIYLLNRYVETVDKYTLNRISEERPQILSVILKSHLDEAYDTIKSLDDIITNSTLVSVNKDIIIQDALSMCRKVLESSPFIVSSHIEDDEPFPWNVPVV